jgi:hypothetical protein
MIAKPFQLALPALAFFTVVSSFAIPDGQPDGTYMYSIDEFGNGIHTPVNITESTATAPRTPIHVAGRAVEKRVNWPSGTTVDCQNDYLWSDNFYHGAFDKFFQSCHDNYLDEVHMYSITGQAKAYICNYDIWQGSVCRSSEWVEFVNWASGQCKQGTNGWKQAGMCSVL